MKECAILGVKKRYIHIFRGQEPQPPGSTPLVIHVQQAVENSLSNWGRGHFPLTDWMRAAICPPPGSASGHCVDEFSTPDQSFMETATESAVGRAGTTVCSLFADGFFTVKCLCSSYTVTTSL